MAITTSLIVEGTVVRSSTRTLPATEKRGALVFNNVLIVGDDCMADCTLDRSLDLRDFTVGTVLRARVEVGSYRDEDSVTLVEVFPTLGSPAEHAPAGKPKGND